MKKVKAPNYNSTNICKLLPWVPFKLPQQTGKSYLYLIFDAKTGEKLYAGSTCQTRERAQLHFDAALQKAHPNQIELGVSLAQHLDLAYSQPAPAAFANVNYAQMANLIIVFIPLVKAYQRYALEQLFIAALKPRYNIAFAQNEDVRQKVVDSPCAIMA